VSALRFPRCADTGCEFGSGRWWHQLAMPFVSRDVDRPAVPAPTRFVGLHPRLTYRASAAPALPLLREGHQWLSYSVARQMTPKV
jgi:hypothetical protein